MEAEIFPGRVRISQHSDCPGLRDEFARSAMHAELSRLRRHGRANIEELADWAYQVADAMMRRREIDDEDDVRGE